MTTPDIPGMPKVLTWTCTLCPPGRNKLCGDLEDLTAHMSGVHGMQAERWPDGSLVIDMSEVPELIDDMGPDSPG